MSQGLRVDGGLLPSSLLDRLLAADPVLEGTAPSSYHCDGPAELSSAISRAWATLAPRWLTFKTALDALPESSDATALTRERWLLPLLQELGYGRLPSTAPLEVDGRAYPISHAWGGIPVHLVGARTDLDARVAGASPHGMLQDLLNRSEGHRWAILSNGLELRLLRDHAALTRQAGIAVDLESIFTDESFSGFRALWLLVHQSRLEDDRTEKGCWLERWFRHSRTEGVQAVKRLRGCVKQAIEHLGSGFLRNRSNTALHDALRGSDLTWPMLYAELRRLTYQLIFVFVAEERGLLLDPNASAPARQRYESLYHTGRLRQRARRHEGSAHEDAWIGLRVVLDGLDAGVPALALPALGGALFHPDSTPWLRGAHIDNQHLYDALRALGEIELNRRLWPIDWSTVQADELGSVYEGLLEYEPDGDLALGSFRLEIAPGNSRKKTGSYYTPSELVDALLDEALEPVLDRASQAADPVAALLALRVVDPACGSGHFLVAAGRRLALRLARARAGGLEPSREEVQHALREVVGRCLYGVDLEPTAVELCKVALWLEALEPGASLAFLDSHIRAGNALLGATPEAMEAGIPDEAWDPLTGDDRDICKRLKKANRDWRQGQLFGPASASQAGALATAQRAIDAIDDRDRGGQLARERAFQALEAAPSTREARLLADLWCAAFVWPRQDAEDERSAPVRGSWEVWRRNPERIPEATRSRAKASAKAHQFLHWHLTFADVFAGGGFDVVLGNPPWERIKLQEEEFFAVPAPDIASAPNAATRKRKIAALQTDNPALWVRWVEALRASEGESALIRRSNIYPLCGRGDINTYAIFAERMRRILSPQGHSGAVVPFGIATDATTSAFFMDLVQTRTLRGLFGFENEGKLFDDVDHRVNFCLLVVSGSAREGGAEFSAFLRSADQLRDPDRRFHLSAEDIALINPNTGTCPVFRTRRDAEITRGIYRRVPVLWRESPPENPWGVSFLRLLDMANDSGLFRTRGELERDGWVLQGNVFGRGDSRYLPLYEAKMMQLYDHRYGDFGKVAPGERGHILPPVSPEEHDDPSFVPLPRYWVDAREAEARLEGRWDRGWLLGWRDVTDARSSARTVIAGVIPRVACNHKYPLILPALEPSYALCANLSSFILDYVGRQKIGGVSLTFFVLRQLPVLPPETYVTPCPWFPRQNLADWIRPRVLELTYTSHDLAPFAADLGYTGPPFRWDERRRLEIRCELDAAFFHLYGLPRDDAAYILDTFPIVRDREQDPRKFGEYLSKRLILETYDALAAAGPGHPWTSPLSPPPGDPAAAHPGPEAPAQETLSPLEESTPMEAPLIPGITRVVFEGYRSIRALDARLEPFSVIVGPNGSGKTNVLNALALLGDLLARGSLEPLEERGLSGLLYQHNGKTTRELVLGAELRLRPLAPGADDPPWLRVAVRLEIEAQGPDYEPILRAEQLTLRPEHQRGIELDLRIERDRPRVRLTPGAEGLVTVFAPGLDGQGPALVERLTRHLDPGPLAGRRNRSIFRLLNLSRHYSPMFQELVDRAALRTLRPESGALKDLSEGGAGLSRTGKGLAGLIRRLRGGGAEPSAEYQADVLAVLRQIFPEVEDVSTAAVLGNLLALKVRDAEVGGSLTPDQVSDGFLHLLGVLVATADRQAGALGLEEPENAIHPWALRILLDHLQDLGSRQILVSTHSPVAVDRLRDPAGLLLAERDPELGTTLIAAPDREEALASILAESGMKLGEVWYSGLLGGVVRGAGP